MAALSLEPRVESLGPLADYVRVLAGRARLGERGAYRLRLAADEIITNAIWHGRPAGRRPIVVEGGVCPDRVWLRIRAEGPHFDPVAYAADNAAAAVPVRPAGAEIGGLGIHLALRSVDEFEYGYVDGANQSTLTVYREEAAAA